MSMLTKNFFFSFLKRFTQVSLFCIISFVFFWHIFQVFFFTYCYVNLPLHNHFLKEFSRSCDWELNSLNRQVSRLSVATKGYLSKLIWIENCQSFCDSCLTSFGFIFLNYVFVTVTNISWKSDNPVQKYLRNKGVCLWERG